MSKKHEELKDKDEIRQVDIVEMDEKIQDVAFNLDNWKHEAENEILCEVAERRRRESNIVVYELEESNLKDDINSYFQNFSHAPIKNKDT